MLMEVCPARQGAVACSLPSGHAGVHLQRPDGTGNWWNDEMATTVGATPLEVGAVPPIPVGTVVDLRERPASRMAGPCPFAVQREDGVQQCGEIEGHAGPHRFAIVESVPVVQPSIPTAPDFEQIAMQEAQRVYSNVPFCRSQVQRADGLWACLLRQDHLGDHQFPSQTFVPGMARDGGAQGAVPRSASVIPMTDRAFLVTEGEESTDDLKALVWYLVREIARREASQ